MPRALAFLDLQISSARCRRGSQNSGSLPIIRLHLLNLFKLRPYFIRERTMPRRIRRAAPTFQNFTEAIANAISRVFHPHRKPSRNLPKCSLDSAKRCGETISRTVWNKKRNFVFRQIRRWEIDSRVIPFGRNFIYDIESDLISNLRVFACKLKFATEYYLHSYRAIN